MLPTYHILMRIGIAAQEFIYKARAKFLVGEDSGMAVVVSLVRSLLWSQEEAWEGLEQSWGWS